MRVNIAIPEPNVEKPVLDAALEAVTRLDEQLIREGAPLLKDVVHQLRWKPEPPGQEHFDHAGIVLKRGHGDCDDLAPYHAASLRHSGVDPGARAVVKKVGEKRWHAIVERSNGKIEDPSLAAGMPGPKGTRAAAQPSMALLSGVNGYGDFVELPQLAMRPRFGRDSRLLGWEARADLPWQGADVAFASMHGAEEPESAVVGALRGAVGLVRVAGLVSGDVLGRAQALVDVLEGSEFGDMVGVYGYDETELAFETIGSFWDDLAGVASKVVSFVPGIGPIASTAIDVTREVVKKVQAGNAENAARVEQAAQKKAAHHAKLAQTHALVAKHAKAKATGGPPVVVQQRRKVRKPTAQEATAFGGVRFPHASVTRDGFKLDWS